jgi:hypothetical protein
MGNPFTVTGKLVMLELYLIHTHTHTFYITHTTPEIKISNLQVAHPHGSLIDVFKI